MYVWIADTELAFQTPKTALVTAPFLALTNSANNSQSKLMPQMSVLAL
jgi:hypothetical protein